MLVDRGSKNILSVLSVLSVFVFVCWVVHLLIFTDSCTSWRTLADVGGRWRTMGAKDVVSLYRNQENNALSAVKRRFLIRKTMFSKRNAHRLSLMNAQPAEAR